MITAGRYFVLAASPSRPERRLFTGIRDGATEIEVVAFEGRTLTSARALQRSKGLSVIAEILAADARRSAGWVERDAVSHPAWLRATGWLELAGRLEPARPDKPTRVGHERWGASLTCDFAYQRIPRPMAGLDHRMLVHGSPDGVLLAMHYLPARSADPESTREDYLATTQPLMAAARSRAERFAPAAMGLGSTFTAEGLLVESGDTHALCLIDLLMVDRNERVRRMAFGERAALLDQIVAAIDEPANLVAADVLPITIDAAEPEGATLRNLRAHRHALGSWLTPGWTR